jgi:hypothetical protein
MMNSQMERLGALKPERGLAGLGEVFATGGRVKKYKKKK